MIRVAQLAAAALRHSALQCEGVNVFLADGESAGQDYSTSTCMLFRGLMVTASVCGCRPTIGCGLATNWMSRHRRCGKPGLSGDIHEHWPRRGFPPQLRSSGNTWNYRELGRGRPLKRGSTPYGFAQFA
jgi:hypothetical protein